MNRVAAIDLGTNTFHLLIVKPTEDGFEELYRHKKFVYLAENGIDQIGKEPLKRALDTLLLFKEKMEEYGVKRYKAVGTAALRKAKNGQELTQAIEANLGIHIDIISGNQEADLIFQGTKLAIPFDQTMDLIMDIGGGSVEFIICNSQGNLWRQSFPIGVAILYAKFHKNDPITPKEVHDIENHLSFHLTPLIDQARDLQIHQLIGASGSFEVVESMLKIKGNRGIFSEVDLMDFKELHHQIINSTFDERLLMEGLPESRAKLIVVAIVLMNFVCKKISLTNILVSPYALKEGIIGELLQIDS